MENMFNLLDEKSNITNDGDVILAQDKSEIEFKNVKFGYDKKRVILKGISFKVPNGKKVAIVGPTGAGKSTISRLLFRFYDPIEGDITINNENLRSVNQESLRQKIGSNRKFSYYLFNLTIFYIFLDFLKYILGYHLVQL